MNLNNIDELVLYVNEKLKNKQSVAQIERDLNIGKDTVRKRLNRSGYKLNKEKKEFVLQDNITVTRKKKIKNNLLASNKNITQGKDSNTFKTQVIIQNKDDNTNVTNVITQFSEDEIIILKDIIREYKGSKSNEIKLEGKVIIRSFRTYENVLNEFSEFCKNNNLSQKDTVARALIEYMNK